MTIEHPFMTSALPKNNITLGDVKSTLSMEGSETGVRSQMFERQDRFSLHPSLTIETEIKDAETDIFRAIPFMFDREEIYFGLRDTQPKTYAALIAGSDFYLVVHEFESFPDEWEATHSSFIVCKDRVIGTYFIFPSASQTNKPLAQKGKFATQFLGEVLGKAYYGLIEGFTLAREFPMSALESYALPAPISNWLSLDTHLMRLENPNDDYFTRSAILKTLMEPIKFFSAHFPDVKKDMSTESKSDPLSSLRCWVTNSETGDLVILYTPKDETQVKRDADGQPFIFHIKDNDWRSFSHIINPVKVMDDYVSGILNNHETPFDFTPHLVSL